MGVGYPTTIAEANAAVPGATFSHGWLINETSGNLEPAFGGVTLVASGTGLIYGDAGPRGGGDRSVGFTASSSGKFSAATQFDIAANTDELVVAWVGKWSALPSVFGTMFGNASASFVNGWSMTGLDATGMLFALGPGGVTWAPSISGTSAFLVGQWHVGIAVVDRSGTDSARFGVQALFGSSPSSILSAANTGINGSAASSASNFSVGTSDWSTGNTNFRIAALYVGKGTGVAAGLSAGLSAALTTFADTIGSASVVHTYQRMLGALFPPGRVWSFVDGGVLSNLLMGAATELMRVDARVTDMLNEADPSTATELLPEYERELGLEPLLVDTDSDGLPDAPGSIAERRANIVARLVARQKFRPVDFQTALAPLLGQASVDVVVLERTHAVAVSLGDEREIFRFFVYRDPALPGTYYVASAQVLVDKIKPSHTRGFVIESISAKYDESTSLYDRDILGV